jgi:hypothetical protein
MMEKHFQSLSGEARSFRMRITFVIALLHCVVALHIAGAQVCPDTIAVNQALSKPIAGWTVTLDDAPIRLAGVTFYDGSPDERASLVPDQIRQDAGQEFATWRFTPSAKRQIWVACGYANTAVMLTRSLPQATRSCTVTYVPKQRVAGMQLIKNIVCN